MENTNSGPYATVPGGDQNLAGTNSLAAGHRAKANHDGTFVWADSNVSDFASTGNDQFLIRASGGVGIGTNNPSQTLHVIGNILATGTVNGTSDRNAKENFTAVNPPATCWTKWRLCRSPNGTIKNETRRHIGPMAQDFYAAFSVGMDDKHIATVDADGVALAAIQRLNQKLTEELNRRDAENAELKQTVNELKELVKAMKPETVWRGAMKRRGSKTENGRWRARSVLDCGCPPPLWNLSASRTKKRQRVSVSVRRTVCHPAGRAGPPSERSLLPAKESIHVEVNQPRLALRHRRCYLRAITGSADNLG